MKWKVPREVRIDGARSDMDNSGNEPIFPLYDGALKGIFHLAMHSLHQSSVVIRQPGARPADPG
jgi:hypothetical protein